MTDLNALAAFAAAIGSDSVITSPVVLKSAATATFPTTQSIPALVRPHSREEVERCLAIARDYQLQIYPVSSGKNWGYGSRVPVADQCVLMDLGLMNRIVDFNEELAWVTIEPGVTQQQLFTYLKDRRSRLWIDATGSTPDASIIGNTMERGFGHTPYGDHAGNVCGLEVVLPNGSVVRTGMARFGNAHGAPVYRWGLGPGLDGLFMQSNLGIVTQMTLWLMPAPDYFEAFFFRCDSDEALPAVIDALRPLRMNGTLRSSIHIANDYKVIAGIRQYPWSETGGATPLQPAILSRLRTEMKFGAWNGSGGLYGTRTQVREARRLLRRALTGKANRITFLNDRLLSFAGRFSRAFGLASRWDVSRALELVRPVYGLMKGIPTDRPLASAYWRKPHPPPTRMDPDHDGCGLLWSAPVGPAEGKHARAIAGLAGEILLRHGFEPMLSITLISERALICVISITWDRALAGEDERAMVCFEELQNKLDSAGYVPYRLGVQSMAQGQSLGAHEQLLDAIRNEFDPGRLLAPGRYDHLPRQSRSSE